MSFQKYGVAAFLAALATLFQVSVMRDMVGEKRFAFVEPVPVTVGKFIRVKKFRRDAETSPLDEPAEADAPPDPPPEETPPEPEVQDVEDIDVSVDIPVGGNSLFGVSFSDGDYLPIVKIPADYPEAALRKGIEGWALVSFTVSKTGSVKNPSIVRAEPPGFFERSALRAVKKFKYKPKIVGGEAVEVKGVTNRIVFKLEDVK